MYEYYVDGSCSGNGSSNSSGGWAVVKIDKNNNILWEDCGFKSPTTNNEMELFAILQALKYINKKQEIGAIIYSDSSYCVNLINNWMYSWEKNNWKRPKNQEVKNLEIIKQIFDLAGIATIKKVSGHRGIFGNERSDKLASKKIVLMKEDRRE